MNFYTKVLSRFAAAGGLKLTVSVDVSPPAGLTATQVQENEGRAARVGSTKN